MAKPTTLRMQAFGQPSIEGYGERLTYTVTAYRNLKSGRRVDYVLQIEACRHSVKQLAEAMRAMQERDLEHIARQQARIRNEVAPLARTP